ncbi:hypothetical protein [Phormidesmis priestleyi]|uniref:hypothetical protein n=1 Tax=Phormidesmis priestleyi TaxID=268141 RepID=UPI000A905441|nr:hypothetical protein [Phormidesmis priestleyi]
MCKLCAIAARYPASRVRQDSLVFNLSQFAVAIETKLEAKPLSEQPQDQSLTYTQEKPS